MNRKGDLEMWTQIFFIVFFVLILIVAIILLTLDQKRLQDVRPELGKDLADQRASQILMSLLRSEAEVNGRSMSFADVIIFNERGGPDLRYTQVNESLQKLIPPGTYFTLTVHYSNGGSFSIENSDIIAGHLGDVGRGAALLPGSSGNANIVLLITDDTQCKREGWTCTAKPLDLKPLGKLPTANTPVTREQVQAAAEQEKKRDETVATINKGSIQ